MLCKGHSESPNSFADCTIYTQEQSLRLFFPSHPTARSDDRIGISSIQTFVLLSDKFDESENYKTDEEKSNRCILEGLCVVKFYLVE